MRRTFRGPGLRGRRRWIYAGTAGIAAAIAYWLLPFGDDEPWLRLVTAAPDGGFAEDIRVPHAWVDTSRLTAGAVVRVPLILAVTNRGGRAVMPGRLELSAPPRYRLVRNDGRPLDGRLAAGSPLVRYELPVTIPRVPGGDRPVPLLALDTLWLEPVIPSFYCVALSDSVPDFVPAPPPAVEAISRVQIFYSFDGGDLDNRHTGLLTVQLDPALLKREAPDPPPVFPAVYREPEAPMPALGALRYAGSRRAFCGEPEYPIELLSTLWETPAGGRFFVIDHGGAPRKYLFDMDRDSIIELEVWDPDGDGDFETRREARLPIPAFLVPPPPPSQPQIAFLDSIPEDRLPLYDRFGPILARDYEPRTAPPDSAPRTARFRPLVIEGDDDEDVDRDDAVARRPPRGRWFRAEPAPRAAPGHTGRGAGGVDRSGPPRTQRTPPDERDRVAPPAPATPDEPAGRQPAADDREAERTRTPRPPGPKLLGRPVDSIPPQRPDTTRRRR